jgi:hypothetical protein
MTLTRAAFKAMVDQAPRVRGERRGVQWVNDLKLCGLLAQQLKLGTLIDPLHDAAGARCRVLRQFAEDVSPS